MTGNQASNRCWAYQTAVGTESIDDATDTTYFFGKPEEEKDWTVPDIITDVEANYSYSSREPSLTPSDPRYKTFMTSFHPNTAQYIAWMLKQVTEDGESANVHLAEVLDSGLPLPLTIRYELKDGSVDRIFQAVDCYCIGQTCSATLNSPFLVECEWAFGRLEDRRGEWYLDDTVSNVAGDVIKLTDNTLTEDECNGFLLFVNGGDEEDTEYAISDTGAGAPATGTLTLDSTPSADLNGDTISVWDKERPILTTPTTAPGTSATNLYNGTPKVYWDVADQNVNLTECWQASWQNKQNFKQYLDSDRKYATTYLYKHEPINITLEMICERHKQVYDYIDRKANQINISVYKPDTSYYITHRFYNCYIIGWTEAGPAFGGLYNARVVLKAESMDAIFTLESETNWSTHYKTVS